MAADETKKIENPAAAAPKPAKPYSGEKYEMGEPTMEGEGREAWIRAKKAAQAEAAARAAGRPAE